MRLDKLLASSGLGSRSDVRKAITRGRVQCDGITIRDPGFKCADDTVVLLDGAEISKKDHIYILFDKADGVLTAMEDPRLDCVGNHIDPVYKNRGVSPVGRLDFHTTGLLLLTNDGVMSHRLTSPKYAVPKKYLVEYSGEEFSAEEILECEKGVILKDKDTPTPLAPCRVENRSSGVSLITLTEGKTHEVRRLCAHFRKEVINLRRVALGPLTLPDVFSPDNTRPLSEEEVLQLRLVCKL